MEHRKLTLADLHGRAGERFGHLVHEAGLSNQGRVRVAEAMDAAVAHVVQKKGLQFGMQSQHVDTAMHFLDKYYEGRKLLKPKEREIIETSLKGHFGIKDAPPPETPVENEETV